MKKNFLLVFLVLLEHVSFAQNDSLKGGELYSSNFLIDGIQRDFIYYIPLNYEKSEAHALVIFLHNEGKNGKDLIKNYGNKIQLLADSFNAVVIYPDAVAARWNDKLSESFPTTDTVNDVGFISILIDYFKQVYSCDARRIYVAGIFNGGNLAYRLSCDIPNKITAIAPFILADVTNRCSSDKSVAVMPTDGLVDPVTRKLSSDAIEKMLGFFMPKVKE